MAALSHRECRWEFAPTDAAAASRLAGEAGLPPPLAQILLHRGAATAGAAREFLRPELSRLHDPALLPGVAEAAERICRAIADKESIVVYGDYDADGVTATAILLGAIERAGGQAQYYLPGREEEGYGLNSAALRRLADQGAKLIVTVDCGVTSVTEAALARELGVDLIITDHHEPGPVIPGALVVINPLLPGSGYPFPRLTGAGVAFKVAWAMGQRLSAGERVSPEFRAFLVDAVALAAIGAIADVAPLLDENRILASFGVQALAATTRPGVRALCRVASLGTGAPRAWDVAFKLAPRLNAAGRLGCARRAVDLLTTTDPVRADEIALDLDRENTARRAIQEQIIQEALAMVDAGGGTKGRLGLVLAGDAWRQGVVGIVAGQLADRFARPTVVIAIEDGVGHGSARSGGYVNLHAAIERCADLLLSFGGHEHAAGLRIAPANIPAFADRFEQALAGQITEASLAPSLRIDLEMPLDAATPTLARDIARLEPFGAGNPEPVFATLGARVAGDPRRTGAEGKHLSFWVSQNGTGIRAIAFNQGSRAEELRQAGVCSLAYCLRMDTYRGGKDVELDVKDFRLGAAV